MLRLRSTPRLRSLIHTQRPTPSSVYLDPTRSLDASTSSTPDDLSSAQRKVLEAALRVDQAGEVAANYIYAGQFAVLRRDPATAALIQVSIYAHNLSLLSLHNGLGYVGPREKTPQCHEQATGSASSTANGIMGGSKGSGFRAGCCHGTYGEGGGDGMHRGS
jgi:hypothetical protein